MSLISKDVWRDAELRRMAASSDTVPSRVLVEVLDAYLREKTHANDLSKTLEAATKNAALYEATLNEIATWGDGVGPALDEPCSAELARNVLTQTGAARSSTRQEDLVLENAAAWAIAENRYTARRYKEGYWRDEQLSFLAGFMAGRVPKELLDSSEQYAKRARRILAKLLDAET